MHYDVGRRIPAEHVLLDEHVVYAVVEQHGHEIGKHPSLHVHVVMHVGAIGVEGIIVIRPQVPKLLSANGYHTVFAG